MWFVLKKCLKTLGMKMPEKLGQLYKVFTENVYIFEKSSGRSASSFQNLVDKFEGVIAIEDECAIFACALREQPENFREWGL